jgi:hypothetical protein
MCEVLLTVTTSSRHGSTLSGPGALGLGSNWAQYSASLAVDRSNIGSLRLTTLASAGLVTGDNDVLAVLMPSPAIGSFWLDVTSKRAESDCEDTCRYIGVAVRLVALRTKEELVEGSTLSTNEASFCCSWSGPKTVLRSIVPGTSYGG